MRISTKLVVNTVIVAMFSVLVSTISIGWMVYSNANNFLEKLAMERFVSLRDSKVEEIQNYYNTVAKQVVTFAHEYTIIEAMHDFTEAFNSYGTHVSGIKYKTDVVKWYTEQFAAEYAKLNDDYIIDARKLLNMLDYRSFALQYNYILQNPYTINNKSKCNYVPDGSQYSQVHKKFHPIIREFQEKFNYHDILLVDAKTGNIVYSVQKGLDYTTSLLNGPYASSDIGNVFQQANAATNGDYFAITDFAAYLPSYSNVASFIAAPIFDDSGVKIGVLIFRISPDFINSVMTSNGKWERSGWGQTGETYIIGKDSIMRTMSRFFVEDPDVYLQQMAKLGMDEKIIRLIKAKKTTIGLQKINSVGAKAVTQGKTGISYYKDYRKQPVIATYEPLNIPGLDWGVICGLDTVEAFAVANKLASIVIFYSILIAIIIATIAIFIGFELSRQISVPIEKFNNMIYWLANEQDLTKRVKVSTNDELGQMANALNTLIDNLQQTHKTTAAAEENSNFKQDDIDDLETTEDSLELLTARLESLSNQFKIFEEETERTSGW